MGNILKPKKMSNKDRKAIVKEAFKLIGEEVKNFTSLMGGEKEVINDKYIEKGCIEKGWKLSDFYNTDGKKLNKLLYPY